MLDTVLRFWQERRLRPEAPRAEPEISFERSEQPCGKPARAGVGVAAGGVGGYA